MSIEEREMLTFPYGMSDTRAWKAATSLQMWQVATLRRLCNHMYLGTPFNMLPWYSLKDVSVAVVALLYSSECSYG
jgi:hypothetical protein